MPLERELSALEFVQKELAEIKQLLLSSRATPPPPNNTNTITYNGEEYVDFRTAAKIVGKAFNTVKTNHRQWGWTKYKHGQRVYFKKSDIEDWLSSEIRLVEST